MTAHPCPDCRCWTPDDQRPPQPAVSTVWARRQAIDAAKDAVRAAKDRRLAAVRAETRTDTTGEPT